MGAHLTLDRYNAPVCKVEELDPEQLMQAPIVKEYHDMLMVCATSSAGVFFLILSQDWAWRFGETPDFEHNLEKRFEWGIMDINFNSKVLASLRWLLLTECSGWVHR